LKPSNTEESTPDASRSCPAAALTHLRQISPKRLRSHWAPVVRGNTSRVCAEPGGEFLAVDSSYIYWTNAFTYLIGRVNLDGSNPNSSFISGSPGGIAITPDGKTAYVVNSMIFGGSVTPIDVATNTAGPPLAALLEDAVLDLAELPRSARHTGRNTAAAAGLGQVDALERVAPRIGKVTLTASETPLTLLRGWRASAARPGGMRARGVRLSLPS